MSGNAAWIEEQFTNLVDLVLERLPADNQPARVIHYTTSVRVPWDNCCDGQISARLVSMLPVVPAKGAGSLAGACGISHWNAVGELLILRCAATIDDQAVPPAPEVIEAEGSDGLELTDLLVATVTEQEWVTSFNSWAPQGPFGQCRGVAVTFGFKLDTPTFDG